MFSWHNFNVAIEIICIFARYFDINREQINKSYSYDFKKSIYWIVNVFSGGICKLLCDF